ncbi:MAG: DUF364 domain-containing protein [Desulfovibrionaceae bacterium]
MFYTTLQDRFQELLDKHNLKNEPVRVTARMLSAAEAIGNPDRPDYPLLKGKEFLVQATCLGAVGQAYADDLDEYDGPLHRVANLPLDSTKHRGLFTATLNAVVRALDPDLRTVHCKDAQPAQCAEEMGRRIREADGAPAGVARVGLVGLQPAILSVLSRTLGPEHVACLDRDREYVGKSKCGVPIAYGDEAAAEALFQDSDLVLATGSTLVNGSLPGLLDAAERNGTPLRFFGTTIAGTARLLDLPRWCFQAH